MRRMRVELARQVETIGDAFMCAGGVPDALSPVEGARRAADMALAMVEVSMSSCAPWVSPPY